MQITKCGLANEICKPQLVGIQIQVTKLNYGQEWVETTGQEVRWNFANWYFRAWPVSRAH